MIPLFVATEDALSFKVCERLIRQVDATDTFIIQPNKPTGNGQLKSKISKYIELAHTYPVFMLTDLDRLSCPLVLLEQWLGGRQLPQNMLIRIAVRETESWLLADREGFSRFVGAPISKIPDCPESLPDPKVKLLQLVGRYATKPIKGDILPDKESASKVGIGYNHRLNSFVDELWDPQRVLQCSDSLRRTVDRLQQLRVRVCMGQAPSHKIS